MKKPTRVSHVSSAPPAHGATWSIPLLAFGPIALAAELLLVHTHHRPLGAVTFAVVALGIWIGVEIVVRRAFSESVRLPRAASVPREALDLGDVGLSATRAEPGGRGATDGSGRAERSSRKNAGAFLWVVWLVGSGATALVLVRLLLGRT